MTKCVRLLVLLACAFTAPAQVRQQVETAKGLILSNDHVRLEFEPAGMGLKSMVDLATGKEHVQPSKDRHLLWQLKLGRGTLSHLADNNYKQCSYARVETLPGGDRRAVMEWNEIRWWKEDRALTVRVVVDLPADSGIASWRISVESHSDYWGLYSVSFPAVNGFPAAGVYDIARPVFASGGHLLRKRTEPVGDRHPSGFWPMQFCSLHDGNDSVYLGTRDSEGRAKNFLIEPGKRTSVIHHPENLTRAGSDWQDYYAVEFGVFQGSWVGGAKHYREWALQQKWAGAGRLSQRAIPEAARNAAFWLRDRWLPQLSPDGSAVPADIDPLELNKPLAAALDRVGLPAGLHWYNWHKTPYDNNYPHFLPAKDGFAARVKQLGARGTLVMPYINGCSADMNIPDWDKFAPYANVDEQGGFRHHFYSETAGRMLTMCPSQSYWQGTIGRLAEDLLRELHVNAIYVDQVAAMEHELCFNPEHGHPLGGGRYWADGNREVMRRVHEAAVRAGKDVAITSEGADEIFFDLLDANLMWSPPSADEIPLMQVVYSGPICAGTGVDRRPAKRMDGCRPFQRQARIEGLLSR